MCENKMCKKSDAENAQISIQLSSSLSKQVSRHY